MADERLDPVDAALARCPAYCIGHRKGEKEGEENRPLYTLQLTVIRHSAWVAGYGWPDYETPFVTGPTGTGPGTLAETLNMLADSIEVDQNGEGDADYAAYPQGVAP